MAKTRPNLSADFVDLLAAFAGADVRYLVIGGYAVGYHDRPRTTKDLDLLLDPDPANVERACDALRTFGAPDTVIADLAAANDEEIVWMGVPPLRVDFLKRARGIDFPEAWSRRVSVEWSGARVFLISRDDLVVEAGRGARSGSHRREEPRAGGASPAEVDPARRSRARRGPPSGPSAFDQISLRSYPANARAVARCSGWVGRGSWNR